MTKEVREVLGSILIVDDELANLRLLSQILTAKGYKVRAAKTGHEAVASVQSELPDLILLDIMLPDIQGYEVCEILKSNDKSKDIPIIFLSSLHETSEKLHAFSVGAVDYITKPFFHEEVLVRVQTHLAICLLHSELETQARKLLLANAQLKFEAEQRKLKETALKSSEKRFRDLFENSSAVKLVLDPETGNILESNRAAADFYGWSIEQLKQMRIQEINVLPEADIKVALENIRTIGWAYFEFQHSLSDGSIREVEVSSTKIEVGGKDQIYSIIHDITDRKNAEKALRDIEVNKREEEFKRQIEARYSATFAALNDGLWDWHVPSGDAVFSDVYYKMLGYNDNEFPASYVSWLKLIHPGDIEKAEQIFRRSFASGQGFNLDLRMEMKSGEWKWVAIRGKAIESDSENRPLRMIGTLSDISERKQAERKLTESHELLNNLASLVPGVVYQYRLYPDGRSAFPYSSPGINTIYEVSPEDVKEDATLVFSRLHPDDYDNVAASIQESARTLQTFYCEFRVILPKQGLRWRWSQAQPERMEDGGTLWHGIISDITERKESEDQLINLSQRLQLATSSASLGVWDWNVRDNIIIWNDRMFELYGITPDTFSNNIYAWMNGLHPDDKETAIAECQAALKGDKEFDTVFRVLHPDGAVKYLKANGLVLPDADGTAVRMIGVNADITEHKNAENALKSNITKLEVLLGVTSLPTADIKTISDHVLSSVTRLMESEYGFYGYVSDDQSIMTIHSWSGEAMENCSMVDKPSEFAICKSGVWAEAVRRRKPLILNNYAADHPAKMGLPTGHVQLTNLLVLPFLSHGRVTSVAAVANRSSDYSQDDVAQLTAFLTSVQAITDSKQAEEELRKSEGHLRTLVQTIPDLIWLKDKDGIYLSCNPIFERFFGAKVAAIVGKTDYNFVDRELADSFVENDRKAVLAGKPTSNEEWITFADDGHRILLETIKTPMYDSQGTLIGVLGIGRNITERRRAEEENTQLQIQLQQAQKMEAIGTLAGGIAHDFNNILGAILGYAEMAQEDCPQGSMLLEDITQILKAGYRAKELVKQILAFSRQVKSDQIPLQPAVIIDEAIKLLRASLPATITIEQELDSNAGLVLADPTQIHQILMNLCTNAFHAMELRGGILNISLQKKRLTKEDLPEGQNIQPGNFIQLSIKDTGVGISPEILEKIFDPYFTTKEVGKGTGMGLAMVHGIVQSYGGAITCDSQLGKGTVFSILLPTVEYELIEKDESADISPIGKEHILLIDDEEILIELGTAMLQRLGYRVTARSSSIEALTTFQNQPEAFDIIITDQTMPGMTGLDLARRILQIRPDIPIILCTGYSNLISEEKAKALGIKGFSLKPLAKKDIALLIRKVLA